MNYIVAVWTCCGGSTKTDYYEVDELNEAREMADRYAERARKENMEYSISIYEITNY